LSSGSRHGSACGELDSPELERPPAPELLARMQQLGASLGGRIIGESPDF
jgi:hypothetical protein